MEKPTIRIHNTETNEIIDREMTNDEFAQYKLDKADDKERRDAMIAKATIKAEAQAKLAALGLTVEDLQALGL